MTRKDGKVDKALPIAPPSRREAKTERPDAPDLRIEEIEERHVPRDRNIFDK
jgi:hypothetical protein